MALSPKSTMLERDEKLVDRFHQALKTSDLSEMMVLRLELMFSSSSRINEAVLEDTKAALNARITSSILKILLFLLSFSIGALRRGVS